MTKEDKWNVIGVIVFLALIAALFAVLAVVTGCNTKLDKDATQYLTGVSNDLQAVNRDMRTLRRLGVIGDITLLRISNTKPMWSAEISGSFLGFSGHAVAFDAVTICSGNDGAVTFTTIPIGKLHIKESAEAHEVTIKYMFNYQNRYNVYLDTVAQANDVLESSLLSVATITVPQGRRDELVSYLVPKQWNKRHKLN